MQWSASPHDCEHVFVHWKVAALPLPIEWINGSWQKASEVLHGVTTNILPRPTPLPSGIEISTQAKIRVMRFG